MGYMLIFLFPSSTLSSSGCGSMSSISPGDSSLSTDMSLGAMAVYMLVMSELIEEHIV
jgi:hypothetical protein